MQKSLSIKLALIMLISLLLMLPLQLISNKITERSHFLAQAKQQVSRSWTGSQNIMGAMLVIPYEVAAQSPQSGPSISQIAQQSDMLVRQKFILMQNLAISGTIHSEIRRKGIYKIPVYNASLNIEGSLAPQQIQQAIMEIKQQNPGKELNIGQAYLTTSVSDPRGINSIPILQWQGQAVPFQPGSKLSGNKNGLHADLPGLLESVVITPGSDQRANKAIRFQFALALRGMETLSFITLGREVQVNVDSNWPDPQFIGDFLPQSSEISASGYQANWVITSFASNIDDKIRDCQQGRCETLYQSGFGVKHIESVDHYLQSERALKYAILFIGLSFITFFIFEIVMKLPIHPVQYTLVGFAIAIFYLLLVSLSEHINFALAYAFAGFCCTALLLLYLAYVLKGFKHAMIFSALLTLLYSCLYVIIGAEDYALLMGAFLSFIVLGIMMFSTRNINWYQL